MIRPPYVRWPLSLGLLAMVALVVAPAEYTKATIGRPTCAASYLLGTAYLIGLMALYRRVKGRQI